MRERTEMDWFRFDVRARVFFLVVFIGICFTLVTSAVLFLIYLAVFDGLIPAASVTPAIIVFIGALLPFVGVMGYYQANHAHGKVKDPQYPPVKCHKCGGTGFA